MNNYPLVSIVVPVYNVAEYLPRCMDSLLAQEYPNIEIILVDDGSMDNSLEVCRRYESDKVKVFTKKNGGPASTRNFGIEHCSVASEYLAFVDSDDTVAPDFISGLMAHSADLIVSSFKHVYGNDFSTSTVHPTNEAHYEGLNCNREFLEQFEGGIMGPPWNKLYKQNIVRENGIRFKDMRSLEDIDFVFQYVKHCKNVEFISASSYNYVHRMNTESKRVGTDIYDNYMILHQEMLDWFDASLEPEINRFVYPQYFAVTLRFLRKDDFSTPAPYIGRPLVRKALQSHKCGSIGELGIHFLVKHGWFRLAKRLFLK